MPDPPKSRTSSIQLRLYVVGDNWASQSARANLDAFLNENDEAAFDVEIVDLAKDPGRAARDHIIAVPVLVRVYPLPEIRIIGNLSDPEKLYHELGIKPPGNNQ